MNVKVTYSNEPNNLNYLYQLLIDIILYVESTSETSISEENKDNE